jgi:hypothetical protein
VWNRTSGIGGAIVADDNARGNHTRTNALAETVFSLHDRLTNAEHEIQDHEDTTRIDVRELRSMVDELRRLVLIFGMVSFVSVIVSMIAVIHVITTLR